MIGDGVYAAGSSRSRLLAQALLQELIETGVPEISVRSSVRANADFVVQYMYQQYTQRYPLASPEQIRYAVGLTACVVLWDVLRLLYAEAPEDIGDLPPA